MTGVQTCALPISDIAQRQFDAGNINELELHLQQAPAIQSRLDLMKARAETQMEREHLNRLLGLSGEQIHWQIADELPALPEKELPLENLESLAVNQRLDLAAKKQQAESLAAALRLKKKTRFVPSVTPGIKRVFFFSFNAAASDSACCFFAAKSNR